MAPVPSERVSLAKAAHSDADEEEESPKSGVRHIEVQTERVVAGRLLEQVDDGLKSGLKSA